jgi:hypothetical protein
MDTMHGETMLERLAARLDELDGALLTAAAQ